MTINSNSKHIKWLVIRAFQLNIHTNLMSEFIKSLSFKQPNHFVLIHSISDVSPCPPWTITKSDGMGCLVVYRNKTYHDASTFCQKKGGHLVSVSDWKMFFTIKGKFKVKTGLFKMGAFFYFSLWLVHMTTLT